MKMNRIISFYSIVILIWLSMATTSCEKALYEEDQPVTDIDGNTYKTVRIGNQVWMAENLKVTKYSDGIPLTIVTSQAEWDDMSIFTKAYIWDEEYGAYFSWAAAINETSGSSSKSGVTQGVCPTGWHIPDNEEWVELVDFLGGSEVAGGKLKESGSVHWRYPNIRGSNDSGFTALAGGQKIKSSRWVIPSSFKKHSGFWWSCDHGGLALAYYTGEAVISSVSEPSLAGKTVRCLKD